MRALHRGAPATCIHSQTAAGGPARSARPGGRVLGCGNACMPACAHPSVLLRIVCVCVYVCAYRLSSVALSNMPKNDCWHACAEYAHTTPHLQTVFFIQARRHLHMHTYTHIHMQETKFEWIQVASGNNMSARHGHAMASVGTRVVMFGGAVGNRACTHCPNPNHAWCTVHIVACWCICICVCVCAFVFICAYMHADNSRGLCTYEIHAHLCLDTFICARVCAHIQTHTHAYMCTYRDGRTAVHARRGAVLCHAHVEAHLVKVCHGNGWHRP
jgi:hypothetical protein